MLPPGTVFALLDGECAVGGAGVFADAGAGDADLIPRSTDEREGYVPRERSGGMSGGDAGGDGGGPGAVAEQVDPEIWAGGAGRSPGDGVCGAASPVLTAFGSGDCERWAVNESGVEGGCRIALVVH